MSAEIAFPLEFSATHAALPHGPRSLDRGRLPGSALPANLPRNPIDLLVWQST
jgi:hypothetical protein